MINFEYEMCIDNLKKYPIKLYKILMQSLSKNRHLTITISLQR